MHGGDDYVQSNKHFWPSRSAVTATDVSERSSRGNWMRAHKVAASQPSGHRTSAWRHSARSIPPGSRDPSLFGPEERGRGWSSWDSRDPTQNPKTLVDGPARESPDLVGPSANGRRRDERERSGPVSAETARKLGGEGRIECAIETRGQRPRVQIARHVGGDPQPLADSAQARLGVPQYRASRSR